MTGFFVVVLLLTSATGARWISGTSQDAAVNLDGGGGAAVLMGAIAVALSVYQLHRRRAGNIVIHSYTTDGAYLSLIALSIVGCVAFVAESAAGFGAWIGLLRMIGGTCIGAAAVTLLGLRQSLRAVAYTCVAICALSLVSAVVDPSTAYVGYGGTVFAGLLNWNSGIGYTGGLGLALTLFDRHAPTARARVTWVCSIVVLLAALVMSQSRTAQFSLAVALTAGVIARIRSDRARRSAYFGLAGMSVVAAQRFGHIVLDAAGKDETLTGRSTIWSIVWKAIEHRPLIGYGPGNFFASDVATRLFAVEARVPASAHDSYLELILGTGLIGVIPLAVLLGRARRRAGAFGTEARLVVQPCLVFLVVLAVPLSLLFRNGLIGATFAMLVVPYGLMGVASSGGSRTV